MINRKVKPAHAGTLNGNRALTSGVAQKLAGPLRLVCMAAGSMLMAAQVFASTVVNINTADADTIAASLQGIGPVKAQAIVDYRKQNGLFQSPDDIMKVTGIGIATFELLKNYLSVGSKGSATTGATSSSANSSAIDTSSRVTNPVAAAESN